jgi:hypothetical protein
MKYGVSNWGWTLDEVEKAAAQLQAILATIGCELDFHAEVHHGTYYIDGVRLVRKDGSLYVFSDESNIEHGPCWGCGGPEEHDWDKDAHAFECEIKLPGLYCLDEFCNCGASGNHASVVVGDFLKLVDGEWVQCGLKDQEAVFEGFFNGRPALRTSNGTLVL